MAHRRYDAATEQRMVEDYQLPKMTVKDLAQAYGYTPEGMALVLRRNGVRIRRVGTNGRRYTLDASVFDNLSSEESAYWLGFLYADGHVTATNTMYLRIGTEDAEHLERFRAFMKATYPIHETMKRKGEKSYPGIGLTVTEPHVGQRLRSLGIIPGRTSPFSAIDQIPVSSLRHFVRGVFDGDGCVSYTRPRIIFCGSAIFCQWLRQLLSDEAQTNPNIKIAVHATGLCYLEYGGKQQAARIADWLYRDATIWLERKYDALQAYRLWSDLNRPITDFAPITCSSRSRGLQNI